MGSKSFYNKINKSKTTELIDYIIKNKTSLTFKVDNKYLNTQVLSKKISNTAIVKKVPNSDFSNSPITCLFQINDDRYFFQTFVTTTKTEMIMDLPTELFHLQRRSNYRITIPKDTYYKSTVVYINDKKTKIKAEIKDLSLGGCQIIIKNKDDEILVKAGDEMDLSLSIDKFDFEKLALKVKRVKKIEAQSSLLIGASFDNPDSETIAELQSVLLFLDRIHRKKDED